MRAPQLGERQFLALVVARFGRTVAQFLASLSN